MKYTLFQTVFKEAKTNIILEMEYNTKTIRQWSRVSNISYVTLSLFFGKLIEKRIVKEQKITRRIKDNKTYMELTETGKKFIFHIKELKKMMEGDQNEKPNE